MKVDDQVEIKCSEIDPVTMENVEVWRMGRILSCDDFSFKVEFVEGHGNKCETFPVSILEQGDARLIPIMSFSSMFYE
ncbi:hypothetical protein [Cellulosilyticum sp. I15G10I2]|uniref:hypothetical protein n=1 Tax=Cellulosilyticum sp. I15G10I2 TaxID=1892843 RepID=UPI00085C6E69|nr:hypothetical protein [Cellulosilyticum sp. I15G10I2]